MTTPAPPLIDRSIDIQQRRSRNVFHPSDDNISKQRLLPPDDYEAMVVTMNSCVMLVIFWGSRMCCVRLLLFASRQHYSITEKGHDVMSLGVRAGIKAVVLFPVYTYICCSWDFAYKQEDVPSSSISPELWPPSN